MTEQQQLFVKKQEILYSLRVPHHQSSSEIMKGFVGLKLRIIAKSRCFRYGVAVLIVLVLLISLIDKRFTENEKNVQNNLHLPVKHGVINVILKRAQPNTFDDKQKTESDRIIKSYKNSIRILCYILLSSSRVKTARIIKETWGSHCDDLLFFGGYEYPDLPVTHLNVSEGYENLWGKAKAAILYLARNPKYKNIQYFLKADDDTFVIVENLRKFIKNSHKILDKPVWFGFKLKHKRMLQGYMSGGAGYVFNYEALARVSSILRGETLPQDSRRKMVNEIGSCNVDGEYGVEDLELGKCFLNVGVESINTMDGNDRQRFLPLSYEAFLNGAISSFHWIWSQAWNRIKPVTLAL